MEAPCLTRDDRDPRIRLGSSTYENVDEYVDALNAAIRTHSKLKDEAPFVEVDPDGELGLVQRAMLR